MGKICGLDGNISIVPAIYIGIVFTGLCLWVEMAAMQDVSATKTTIIYGLEPLCGATFAWFLLRERWGINRYIRVVLVLRESLIVQLHGALSSTSVQRMKEVLRKDTTC
ncbi:hypothetical protein ACH5RR_001143 [Cinchona calisaya]|uniref:EamA domain-containing protein n=1 Tax=Cinchona calisaya TaxID=153742 RepID=A0ABD3B3R6_9GENT